MSKQKTQDSSTESSQQKPLRLWPGIVAVIIQLLLRYVLPLIAPDALLISLFGSLIFALVIVVWWAFFSRATRLERWGGVIWMIIALFATRPFLHDSIRLSGMGLAYFIFAVPYLTIAIVVWSVCCRNLPIVKRRATLALTILIACSAWTLLRAGGNTSDFKYKFSWRWTPSAEEQLLAIADNEPVSSFSDSVPVETEPEWPGFRGPNRDGIIHGVKIETDWAAHPPVEMWRRSIGPGWSSFAVHGEVFYTQEQRGEEEIVSCYTISTGEPVWMHRDSARFWEAVGGAGPRGTPTLHDGKVYTLGATGIVNVLNERDGSVVWSRNAAVDTDTQTPIWAFSGSPLVLDDLVLVAAAGSLIAYEIEDGAIRWSKPDSSIECYSSPHLYRINGVTQILLQNVPGIFSVTPADGKLLWKHAWKGYSIVQPAITADNNILISVDEQNGMRRLSVTQSDTGWTVEQRWTSNGVKPYFNDSVIHEGYVYGFEGLGVSCINVNDGTRKWKGGRYRRGQLILLADQDLLIVISEKGDLALVEAVPGQWTELANIPAIPGKTWNHPVLVGDVLLVRNAEEMAAYQLKLL